MEEEQSPETPPVVIPSPDDEDEDEQQDEQQQQQEQERENAAAGTANANTTSLDQQHVIVAAATPPRSEMLNLPRDFLSLRPQEHQQDHHHHHQQQQTNKQIVPKFESEEAHTPTTAQPLIAVQMTPTTTPTVQQQLQHKSASAAVYPRPLASHEEVLRDKDLFLDTLRRLHGSLGFKSLTIPTIGGTQLDLHLLYREVTARGGLQQVIKDRIWKEIKAVFHFPPTTTNASFVLRKYYSSLLHHYEQVYFFRNQGNVVGAPGDNPAAAEFFSDDSDAIRRRRKRSYETADADSGNGNATECIGQTVTGSIVGKFEHGYLVSVTVGNEALKGVLYNVPPGEYVPQFTTTSKLLNGGIVQPQQQQLQLQGLSDSANAQGGELRHKRRRRLGLRKKDPNAPKLNRSAYNFFFAEQRARIRLLQPNREISRMIGDSWSKLTDEQRLPYKQRGLVDKERYRKEIKLYREKMNIHQRPGSGPGSKENSQIENEIVQEACAEEDEVSDEHDEHDEHEQDNGGVQQETLEFKSILSAQA